MERRAGLGQLGIVLSCAVSALIVALSLPFVNWIRIVNTETLFSSLKLTGEAAGSVQSGYTLFNMLSFVQETKTGALGLFAMCLLLLMVVTLYFHVAFILKTLFTRNREKGRLRLYSASQTAMVFSFLTGGLTIVYLFFANAQFGLQGFALSPVVYIIPVLAMFAYCCTKSLEKQERIKNREHGFFMELKKNWILFAFLIPCFIYFFINHYMPMAGAYFAFTQFNYRDGVFASPFIGFENFNALFASGNLIRLTRNTVLYNIVFIGLGNVLQIFFAILVSQVAARWFKRTSQTLIFMPYFVSFVILRVFVYNILEFDYGVVNNLMTSMGADKIDFYNNPGYWPYLIVFFYIWKNLGYGMVIYLATIMGINDEYYDAAKVDGANIFQQIRHITLPLLRPTMIILLLFALGQIMRGQFELFYQLIGNNGALFGVTDIFDTFVYRITLLQPISMGTGTAVGLFQSLFGLIIILGANFLIKRRHSEYALF